VGKEPNHMTARKPKAWSSVNHSILSGRRTVSSKGRWSLVTKTDRQAMQILQFQKQSQNVRYGACNIKAESRGRVSRQGAGIV
jgi:hypothetical protein